MSHWIFLYPPSLSQSCGFPQCTILTNAQHLMRESCLTSIEARSYLHTCRTTVLAVTHQAVGILVA